MNPTLPQDKAWRRWPGALSTPGPAVPAANLDLLGACRRWAASVVAAFRARRARRRQEHELQHLDDRLLRDIGVDPATRQQALPVELSLWMLVPRP